MSATPRQQALRAISARPPLAPPAGLARRPLTELFGSKVFSDAVQRRRLPKTVYQTLRRTIDAGEVLDRAPSAAAGARSRRRCCAKAS